MAVFIKKNNVLQPVSVLQKSNSGLSRVGLSSKIETPKIYPTKSDIIDIDMTDSGTPQRFRVIKANDNFVEVLALENTSDKQQFGSSKNVYENSILDTYLNSTWYNTLSSTAKAAIVDKTFRQDSWHLSKSGNPVYQGKYRNDATYRVSLGSASYGNEITRHVYAISVQDVIDYLEVTPQMTESDTTLTLENIWTMFWNSTTTYSGYPWFRSANVLDSRYVFYVYSYYGMLNIQPAFETEAVRPAFQIDLSKIDFTIE